MTLKRGEMTDADYLERQIDALDLRYHQALTDKQELVETLARVTRAEEDLAAIKGAFKELIIATEAIEQFAEVTPTDSPLIDAVMIGQARIQALFLDFVSWHIGMQGEPIVLTTSRLYNLLPARCSLGDVVRHFGTLMKEGIPDEETDDEVLDDDD